MVAGKAGSDILRVGFGGSGFGGLGLGSCGQLTSIKGPVAPISC